MNEITFGFVKHGAYRYREHILEDHILPSGLAVVGMKHRYFFNEELAREHYRALAKEPFFPSLVLFTVYGLSGLDTSKHGKRRKAETALYVLEGEDAVKVLDRITGHTDPGVAKAVSMETGMKTIRSQFGRGMPDNAFHRSDSHKSARREIMIHFRRNELPDYVWEMLDREPYV